LLSTWPCSRRTVHLPPRPRGNSGRVTGYPVCPFERRTPNFRVADHALRTDHCGRSVVARDIASWQRANFRNRVQIAAEAAAPDRNCRFVNAVRNSPVGPTVRPPKMTRLGVALPHPAGDRIYCMTGSRDMVGWLRWGPAGEDPRQCGRRPDFAQRQDAHRLPKGPERALERRSRLPQRCPLHGTCPPRNGPGLGALGLRSRFPNRRRALSRPFDGQLRQSMGNGERLRTGADALGRTSFVARTVSGWCDSG
jgi:hypothetical protein